MSVSQLFYASSFPFSNAFFFLCVNSYGHGVYTASNPGFSHGYRRNTNEIIVCVALKNTCKEHGDIRVFERPRNVIPVGFLKAF